MHREYHRWHSPNARREMDLLIVGHAGARVLVFPTSGGRMTEWDDRQMFEVMRGHIDRGWLQFYCVNTIDRDAWYGFSKPAAERAWWQEQYDRYLYHEVVPFSQWKNPNPFLIATGASFGGYHAINFGLKHPDRCGRVLSMSGLADVRRFADGYMDTNVYHNSPCDFIAGEHDWGRLAQLRNLDIIMTVGQTDRLQEGNQTLTKLLWQKGIGNALRVWDGFSHDWPVWYKQLPLYIAGHD